MNTIRIILPVLLLVGIAGCSAAIPPPELVNARTFYQRASQGPTATLNPTDLHVAKQSLDVAEASFVDNGDTQNTRDLGYAAGRRVETAEARARGMIAGSQKDRTVAQMHANTEAQARSSNAQLGIANKEIASQGAQLVTQDAKLQSEVQRRQAAELHAEQAAAALAKITALQVKTEARGIVITLSGSVLFASAKWDLLPSAQAKLGEVADALLKQDPESKIVVEGHTDSQGTTASNQELSQKRAQSVRDYLVTRGVAPDRVTSQGFGQTRSIADNGSAEGRANNRRVEIVVKPAT